MSKPTTIGHRFVSSVPDGTNAGLARPSNWNDTHTFIVDGTEVTALSDGFTISEGGVLDFVRFPIEIVVACSDETTNLTTGAAKVTFRMPHAVTLTGVRASLTTASSSGLVTVGINEGGVSILSTDLSIDADERTSTTAATPAVISDAALADDAEITIDIDAAGTGARGLKVTLIGTRVL